MNPNGWRVWGKQECTHTHHTRWVKESPTKIPMGEKIPHTHTLRVCLGNGGFKWIEED
jgi:hypothetical protein